MEKEKEQTSETTEKKEITLQEALDVIKSRGVKYFMTGELLEKYVENEIKKTKESIIEERKAVRKLFTELGVTVNQEDAPTFKEYIAKAKEELLKNSKATDPELAGKLADIQKEKERVAGENARLKKEFAKVTEDAKKYRDAVRDVSIKGEIMPIIEEAFKDKSFTSKALETLAKKAMYDEIKSKFVFDIDEDAKPFMREKIEFEGSIVESDPRYDSEIIRKSLFDYVQKSDLYRQLPAATTTDVPAQNKPAKAVQTSQDKKSTFTSVQNGADLKAAWLKECQEQGINPNSVNGVRLRHERGLPISDADKELIGVK